MDEKVVFEVGNLEVLRERVGGWAEVNFGHSLPKENTESWRLVQIAAGMAEEFSELVLEGGYGLTPGLRDKDKYFDAIADICIWSLDFCWTAGLTMEEVLLHDQKPNRWEVEFANLDNYLPNPVLHEGIAVFIGKLSHSAVKMSQDIRRNEEHRKSMVESTCHLWRCCYKLSKWMGMDLNQLVHKVAWEVVMRNWVKYPDDADVRASKEMSSLEEFANDPRTAAGMKRPKEEK